MEHVEFIDTYHFQNRYHRKKPKEELTRFIDFFWEIEFDNLWEEYPNGFSDVLFPNIGYTYLVNLGTPFIMQLGKESFEMKTDGFLPRHTRLACHHFPGNRIFGIKFKVSPVILQKKVNFAEYRNYIFPLSYLIEKNVLEDVKAAANYDERVDIVSAYYMRIINKYSGSLHNLDVVLEILDDCHAKNNFTIPIEEAAQRYNVSSRTLQRYFEAATSTSGKQALQIMRIRKAVEELTRCPSAFDHTVFGYYDHSHFYKHMKQFIGTYHFDIFQKRFLSTAGAK